MRDGNHCITYRLWRSGRIHRIAVAFIILVDHTYNLFEAHSHWAHLYIQPHCPLTSPLLLEAMYQNVECWHGHRQRAAFVTFVFLNQWNLPFYNLKNTPTSGIPSELWSFFAPSDSDFVLRRLCNYFGEDNSCLNYTQTNGIKKTLINQKIVSDTAHQFAWCWFIKTNMSYQELPPLSVVLLRFACVLVHRS